MCAHGWVALMCESESPGWYLSKFWGQLAQGSTLFWPCLLVVPLNSSPLLLHPTPYRHAAELSHGLGSSPTQQAAVQSFLQNYSKAIEILVNTAKVQPSAQLYILLGKTQIKAKKYREAVESLEKALDYMVCWFYLNFLVTFWEKLIYLILGKIGRISNYDQTYFI